MSSENEYLSSATASPAHHFAEMETQTFARLSHTLQTAAIAALIFAVCAYLPKLKNKSQLRRLPALSDAETGEKQRQSFLKSAKNMYPEGHAKASCSYASTCARTYEFVVQEFCLPDGDRERYAIQFSYEDFNTHSFPGQEHVIIPFSLLPELRKLPDDVLSFPLAVDEVSSCSSVGLMLQR
jgi:hypothetical protein